MSESNKLANVDYRLKNMTNCLYLDGNDDVVVRTGITGNVIIGNVNIPGNVTCIQGSSPWVITGNTNATVSGTVAVSSITSNVNVNPVTVNQGTTPWEVSGNVRVTPDNTTATEVKYADSSNMQMDATDRLRVSQAYDAWWYAPTVDNDTNYRHVESSSGTNAGSIFVQNLASVSLSPGTTNGGNITRISRRRHKMRPTISVRVSLSLNWNGYDTNVTKRAGLFTNFNGTFFQVKDDLSIVCRRRLADGTLIEKVIPRTSFSEDPLDGSVSSYDLRPNGPHTFSTGVTGYVSTTPVAVGASTVYNVVLTVVDRSKFSPGLKGRISGMTPATFDQICMVESVSGDTGPGNVTVTMLADPGVFVGVNTTTFTHDYMYHQLVFGFDFNGNRNTKIRYFINGMFGRQVVHIENFDDTISTPWSNAPAISTRFEVANTAVPGYRPSLLISSETVTMEGPPSENRAFGTAYNNTPVTYTKTQTQEFPILGVALRAGEPYQRADLQPTSIQIIDTANINPQNSGVFFWRLLLNPTIGGTVPTETTVGRASRQWAYTAATTVSGGIELASGYTSQSSSLNIPQDRDFVNLGSNIDYTNSDKMVLVVKLIAGGSADSRLVAQMNFVELL